MSYNVPSKIEKETFETMVLEKIDNNKFRHYKKMFTANYNCPRNSEEYILKENLSDDLLAELDFVLKRIGYNQFDTILKYTRIK